MKRLAVLVVLALAGAAHAQETGGHMGGGDWGGGESTGGGGGISHSSGGGGWSSGGGSSPSWNHDSGWSAPSIPTYTPPPHQDPFPSKPDTYDDIAKKAGMTREQLLEFNARIDAENKLHAQHHTDWFFVLVAVFIGGIFLIVVANFAQEFLGISFFKRRSVAMGAMPSGYAEADVSVLRVAIDGRARKFIQTALKQMAQSCDTKTPEGRAKMLSQVALLLRKLRDAWVYGGALNEPMGTLLDMKATYERHVDDALSRFWVETIGNVQGVKTSQPAPDIQRRSDEGEGLILVTLVIAARTELFTVQRIADGEDLRKALDAAGHLGARELVAIDVIWQPSEENDRMSSMELEARYPAPMLIPIAGALVGKTFCAYCSGPFPAELQSCPHCGAPARERAA